MSVEALDAHLATGTTQTCRCWRLSRQDGTAFGFTDHDANLEFDGTVFQAGTGLTASALSQPTGLSVDNTEAVGALSDAAITEADIFAGRYDGAQVEAWLVQWSDVENRALQFRGSLGEITRTNGGFSAELRGLAEKLNVPTGRVYQHTCAAILGDGSCGLDLNQAAFTVEAACTATDGRRFSFDGVTSYAAHWFERGSLVVLSGSGAGLREAIKTDRIDGATRHVELWDQLRAAVAPGDMVRLTAGCDKRMATCRAKFNNMLNFRGFPDIPGEDWQVAHPTRLSNRSGGSRR